MMSAYLYDFFLPVWCLPTCTMTAYLRYVCLPVHIMSGYLYDVTSCYPYVCLPACLPTWMISDYLYHVFLFVCQLAIWLLNYVISAYLYAVLDLSSSACWHLPDLPACILLICLLHPYIILLPASVLLYSSACCASSLSLLSVICTDLPATIMLPYVCLPPYFLLFCLPPSSLPVLMYCLPPSLLLFLKFCLSLSSPVIMFFLPSSSLPFTILPATILSACFLVLSATILTPCYIV